MHTHNQLPQIVEGLLFAARDPVPLKRLAELLEVDEATALAAVEELQAQLAGRGLQVVRLAGGYALATRPELAPYVARLRQPPPEKLSPAALEVLAIIAYRQPITKAEIDRLRGVDSSSALHSLLEKRLIRPRGRKRAPGRPLLFGTTEQFLRAFGLHDLSELPEVAELRPSQAPQLRLHEPAEPTDEAASGSGSGSEPRSHG
jgi:segregation and condensation protein B